MSWRTELLVVSVVALVVHALLLALLDDSTLVSALLAPGELSAVPKAMLGALFLLLRIGVVVVLPATLAAAASWWVGGALIRRAPD